MIHLQCQGLLCNNLTQYTVARLIAEELGYQLKVSHSPVKPGYNVPEFLQLLQRFADAPIDIAGQAYSEPVDHSADMNHGFDGYVFDFPGMLKDRSPRLIEMQGYFERYEYLRPYKDRIRQWYATEPYTAGYDIHPEDIVLHIRRADFVVHGRALDLSFYTRLLDGLNFRQLYICGIGLDEQVKQVFEPYAPCYVHGNTVDDFCFIKGFNRIVQSQSTYAWWAGFLSEAQEIYAPVPENFTTRSALEQPGIDLLVNDESRYHYIHDVPQAKTTLRVKDVAWAGSQLANRRKPVLYARALRAELAAMAGRVSASLPWRHARWARYRLRQYGLAGYRFEGTSTAIPGGYRKIVLIRINHSYAGFFAYFTFVINQILFCERNNCLPVVCFGEASGDGPNAFYEEGRGANMWEYYFDPVSSVSYDQVMQWVNDADHPVVAEDVVSLTDQDLWHLHLFEKRSVYAYPYGRHCYKRHLDQGWYQRNRELAHRVVQQYVRVKPHVLNKVEQFFQQHLQGRPVLGVHLRGTDKGAAQCSSEVGRVVPPAVYYPHIERYLAEHKTALLFVATDQVQFLKVLQERFGERVVATQSLRSDSPLPAFQLSSGGGYSKGEEVLIDALLLARCDYLLKCTSHVSEAALWFNPAIPSLDLNYYEEYCR